MEKYPLELRQDWPQKLFIKRKQVNWKRKVFVRVQEQKQQKWVSETKKSLFFKTRSNWTAHSATFRVNSHEKSQKYSSREKNY